MLETAQDTSLEGIFLGSAQLGQPYVAALNIVTRSMPTPSPGSQPESEHLLYRREYWLCWT